MERKKWFETVDFYALTGLVCLWVSSWLLMYPHRMLVEVPLFDSVWGAFFKAFGVSAKHNAGVQQQPDLLCGISALVVMTIMQLRGIFRVTLFDGVSSGENQNHRALKIVLNLLSITVHTLFFTMIIKVFLFPETGMSAFPSIERMKTDFFLTLFSVFCIAGMIFSVQSVAKLLFVLLVAVGIFRNISVVSSFMGVTGFAAILFAAAGFYLEFCTDGFNAEKLRVDFYVLSGKYDALLKEAQDEAGRLSSLAGKNKKNFFDGRNV